jgi:cysteine desulfurase
VDYQSAKPVDPRVIEVMLPYFSERFGNPASLHLPGDRATAALEESRADVADFLSAKAEEIVFTSGATEANNLALIGYANRNRRNGTHVVMSEVEHISIHNIGKYLEKEGFRVTKVPRTSSAASTRRDSAPASPTRPSWFRWAGPATRSAPCSPSPPSPRCYRAPE